MKNKAFKLFIFSLSLTFLFIGVIYQEFTLLHFINVSFFIAVILLGTSLTLIIMKSGFFDGIVYGFRRMFTVKGDVLAKQEINDMLPVSQLITLNYLPLLYSGLAMTCIMIAALVYYYG